MEHEIPGLRKGANVTVVLLAVGFGLLLCGGIYACSVPPRRATESFLADLRQNKQLPYALDSTDAADAARTVEALKENTGFWTINFHSRSTGRYTRACLWVRVSRPSGGRFMDVALEEVGDVWRVRDVSFDRSCATQKSGDYRLH